MICYGHLLFGSRWVARTKISDATSIHPSIISLMKSWQNATVVLKSLCTLIHVFEQLSSNEVSGVRLNSQGTVVTAKSQFIRVVSSAWQKVVKNNACWGSARMFSASSASCDAVGSGHDTDWAEPRVVRVQPSIQPLSDEVAKPHQAGEELGEHHRLVNRLQRITVHSVTTHDF